MDLENLRLKHIREQKELLEKQKQQLIEQQRKLDEQLTMKIGERNAANAAVSAAEAAKASLSRKQARENIDILRRRKRCSHLFFRQRELPKVHLLPLPPPYPLDPR